MGQHIFLKEKQSSTYIMAQDEDHDPMQEIEAALDDEKEWEAVSQFLKGKVMSEVYKFHDWNKKYKEEKDAAKRKEKGDRMIVKFLTLDGDSCLPDALPMYKRISKRVKKLKNKDYPTDLFLYVHDKCIFSISTIWDEYKAQKK